MKPSILAAVATATLLNLSAHAQRVSTANVPPAVRAALQQKYPRANGVSWEREKGNYEANWGGASREDNSVLFTPKGVFVEITVAVPEAKLPAGVAQYIHAHYGNARISEPRKVTDAAGNTRYEAEVRGKDLLFDDKGNFIKID